MTSESHQLPGPAPADNSIGRQTNACCVICKNVDNDLEYYLGYGFYELDKPAVLDSDVMDHHVGLGARALVPVEASSYHWQLHEPGDYPQSPLLCHGIT
jgi:hypothetical protein